MFESRLVAKILISFRISDLAWIKGTVSGHTPKEEGIWLLGCLHA